MVESIRERGVGVSGRLRAVSGRLGVVCGVGRPRGWARGGLRVEDDGVGCGRESFRHRGCRFGGLVLEDQRWGWARRIVVPFGVPVWRLSAGG